MSKQAVQNLIKEAQSDAQLQAQLQAAESSAAVMRIAEEKGYQFTEDELTSVMKEQQLSFDNSPVELNEIALKFILEINNHPAWQEELKTINTPADIVHYAAQKGYELTEQDIITVMEKQQEPNSQAGELFEEALEAVAGGADWNIANVGKDFHKSFIIHRPLKPSKW